MVYVAGAGLTCETEFRSVKQVVRHANRTAEFHKNGHSGRGLVIRRQGPLGSAHGPVAVRAFRSFDCSSMAAGARGVTLVIPASHRRHRSAALLMVKDGCGSERCL